MIIALWIATGLLAAVYLMAGFTKATTPREKLASKMPWVEDYSDAQVKTIGILQLLGAIGLIVPAATGILPWLTPVAAFALFVVQILAARVHVRRKETASLPINAVLGILALAVGIFWLFV